MFDVVGVGANSVDYVYRLPEFPKPDRPTAKLRIAHHAITCGGQTATALCTCAALGLRWSLWAGLLWPGFVAPTLCAHDGAARVHLGRADG